MIRQTLTVTVLSLLITAEAGAQSTEEQPTKTAAEQAPTANEIVSAALKARYRSPFTATGTIRVEANESEEMGMMVIGGPASTGKPFEGAIEVVRTARNEVLLASRKSNPGLAILQSGKQVIASTTAPIDEPVDVKALHQNVAAMLDARTFLKWAAKGAKWKLQKNEDSKARTFRAKLKAPEPEAPEMDELGAEGGMGAMPDPMSPRILYSLIEVTLNEANSVTAIALRVTRNDPMAMIAEVAAESGEVDFQALMEAEPVEGPVHHIELTMKEDGPSARSKRLIERLSPKSR